MEILGLVLMALLSALLQPFMTRSIQVLTSVRGTKTHMGTRTIKNVETNGQRCSAGRGSQVVPTGKETI